MAQSSVYDSFWKEADINGDGTLQSNEAVAFFRKSGLEDSTLSDVWEYARGNPFSTDMTRTDFDVAMRMIALAQRKQDFTKVDCRNWKGPVLVPNFGGAAQLGANPFLQKPELSHTYSANKDGFGNHGLRIPDENEISQAQQYSITTINGVRIPEDGLMQHKQGRDQYESEEDEYLFPEEEEGEEEESFQIRIPNTTPSPAPIIQTPVSQGLRIPTDDEIDNDEYLSDEGEAKVKKYFCNLNIEIKKTIPCLLNLCRLQFQVSQELEHLRYHQLEDNR